MKSWVVLALLLTVSSAHAQSPTPVAGTDYIEIPNGRPFEPSDGVIVVEEFFNYACPACNSFEPSLVVWAQQLPAYVKLEHVPASFIPTFVQYARAYYAAQALGLADKTHQAVYDAIHRTHVLPGEGEKPDEARIARFYADFGVKAEDFLATAQSFGVNAKVRGANEHMQRNRIPSTPSLVVNGRYLVRGSTIADVFRIATYLIEKEHAG